MVSSASSAGGLSFLQRFGGGHDFIQLFVGKAALEGCQLFRRFPIHLFGESLFRFHGNQYLVRVLDDIAEKEIFEVIGLQVIPQGVDIVDVAEGFHGIPVIQPEVHGPYAVEKALRTALVIIFTGSEFGAVQRRFQHILVQSLQGNGAEGAVHHIRKGLLFIHFGPCHFHNPYGLLVAVAVGAGQVASKACVQHRLFQRRPVHVDEHIVQNAEGQGVHGGHVVVESIVKGMDGLAFGVFIFRNAIGGGNGNPFPEGSLGLHHGVHISSVEGGEVLPVQIFQGLINIHIAVKVDIAVGGMVETAVEFRKFTEGQGGNHFRVPAGFHAVGGVGEKLFHSPVFHNSFGRRKGPFHFIVNYAVVCEGRFFVFQLVVPAFLHENLGILQAVGIENSIQVHIHQIVEIHIISAGNGIHGLIRPGNGIEERIQGPFGQFHKRFFQRILAGAAEGGMFHNMGHALGIVRGGAECDVKYLVVIIIIQIHETGAALHVLHHIGIGIDFFNMRHGVHAESVNHVA